MQFSKVQQEKGITLIAIIITIIVLIILAAITINEIYETNMVEVLIKSIENYSRSEEYENEIVDNTDNKISNTITELEKILKGITIPDGEYKKVGTTYCNEPDLSRFNPECTYYVTYEGDMEQIYGRIDEVKEPANWYDYGDKKWANVITKSEDEELTTYWVWIPRYEYKLDSDNKTADVKFVDRFNTYKDSNGKIQEVTDYLLPEAFTFGGKAVAGYWVSKYDVQERNGKYEASSINSPKVDVVADVFFDNIRRMEEEGGTLGKNAIIDEVTYLDSSHNGIDCHMIKNTEWGPIAMLTVSQYGNRPESGTESSTGNKTGAYHLKKR